MPGDERRDREAEHLDEDDVDADARGRALVGPDREHRRAQRAPAQQGDTHGHHDADDQAHEAERQAGEVLPDADAEVDAEDLRASRSVLPYGVDEIGVAEPDRLDAERQREA